MSEILLLSSSLLLAIFFGSIYREKRQAYLAVWAAAWVLMTLHFAEPLLAQRYFTRAAAGTLSPAQRQVWVAAFGDWILLLAALMFIAAARRYAGKRDWGQGLSLIGVGGLVWAVAYTREVMSLPVSAGSGVALLVVAWTFWQLARKQESRSDTLLSLTYAAWGGLVLLALVQPRVASLAGRDLRGVVFVPQFFTGVLMVMAVYEEERRRVERNMLALSNLNLVTSSFGGAEIQKMLAQALDRVLNVARIPAGALCLHYGDVDGPTAVVSTGLDEAFSGTMQGEHLDQFVVKLVARLGGLIVLPRLESNSDWEGLERDDDFKRLRRLLLAQKLSTVIGISLQAKERIFGAVLLGSPDSRKFTAAELRLLLALGYQIGLAVENSYLVQQTSRRSEELHILNEIGRVLSSTLETGALFERIYSEMSRLLDVSSFYIAFYGVGDSVVRLELEIEDNERLPKRTRPAGNHLTEYMVRNRQPVLIRDHMNDELARLGVEPNRETGCICGVPLILHDRAIGVMAAHSARERLFDEAHLEMMRVLASEASVAIENAYLFEQEQRKSQQLALLNAISSHAIATLNPDEMLARIAAEMEKGLTYDHIGIATMEYSTKEVIVAAEGGRRREALGRRIPIGEGLVGRVARTGQAEVVREVTAEGLQPVLPGSVAAAALPIMYSDSMMGVLYVESMERADFQPEEMQLLRTLADVFAGALHNAQTYQKAQEQAITDGLTGVKTHRFFMEGLSSEWKRATRGSREFSLVLMDLDRFKFVNDFYGHLEGDVVLQRVGHILEQNCRRSDVVARYGGDEFVILMPETSVDQAQQLASKLRGWVASDPLLRDKNITASFGIASFPVDGSTPQELIQVADSSMYISKHQGGNAVSTPDNIDTGKAKKWKQDVLEAYLGVTLKRMFTTGPEAFEEIRQRIGQFTKSLAQEDGSATLERMPAAVVETVTQLALAVDSKDQYTNGHSQKVSTYAAMLAATLDLDPVEIEEVRLGALLHDVGKVGIPEAILNKSGPLDPAEWEVMKSHADLGAQLLDPLRPIARIQKMVRHHHEYYDGTGYPDGLAGEQIPLGARIVAIADAYDTITSERVYKKPRTPEAALLEIERCAGAQFDPELARAFVETMRRQPHVEERIEIVEDRHESAPREISR